MRILLKNLGTASVLALTLQANIALAESIKISDNILNQKNFSSNMVTAVDLILYHPYVSYLLYASISAAIIGIVIRSKKIISYCAFIIGIIIVFRAFGHYMFGSFELFKATIILPLFCLTIGTKMLSSYWKKKREEILALSEEKSSRRRKSRQDKYKDSEIPDDCERYQNVYKSTALRPESKSSDSVRASSSMPQIKLTRQI